MDHVSTLKRSALVALGALAFSCSQAPNNAAAENLDSVETSGPSLNDLELSRPDADESTPRGIYLPVQVPEGKGVQALEVGGPPLPIFMNFNGGTYSGGFDNSANNVSSVVGQGQATISAFTGTPQQRQQIMDCVTDQFARFNAVVTDVEPAGGDYVESVVGGTPGQVGLPNGVGGVAPIDNFNCNVLSRAVVYTFTGRIGNEPQRVCEVVAQEVAHAISLDHEFLCEDPMSYLNGCGAKEFRDIDAQCGEYSARACNCNRPSHNSVQILLEKLGPADGTPPPPPPEDNELPEVAINSPADNAVLQENTQISVVASATDDAGIAALELVWDFGDGSVFGCPQQGNGVSCILNNGQATWSLQVGTGQRTFRVRARDVAGNVVETGTRTITLGAVSDDNDPPFIAINGPANGSVFEAQSSVDIVAQITDATDVQSAELLWEFSGQAYPCPVNNGPVTCVVSGDEYTWTLNVGEGNRPFSIRARDSIGNEAISERRVLTFESDAPPQEPDPTDPDPTDPDPTDPDPTDPDPTDPPVEPTDPLDDAFENNDTFDVGTNVACASAIDARIRVGNDDWYMLDVAPDVVLNVAVTSQSGAPMFLAIADQADRLLIESNDNRSTKELTATAEGDQLAVRVRSPENGEYRLVITCDSGIEIQDPISSGCPGGSGAMLLPFALLSLGLVRRKRS